MVSARRERANSAGQCSHAKRGSAHSDEDTFTAGRAAGRAEMQSRESLAVTLHLVPQLGHVRELDSQ